MADDDDEVDGTGCLEAEGVLPPVDRRTLEALDMVEVTEAVAEFIDPTDPNEVFRARLLLLSVAVNFGIGALTGVRPELMPLRDGVPPFTDESENDPDKVLMDGYAFGEGVNLLLADALEAVLAEVDELVGGVCANDCRCCVTAELAVLLGVEDREGILLLVVERLYPLITESPSELSDIFFLITLPEESVAVLAPPMDGLPPIEDVAVAVELVGVLVERDFRPNDCTGAAAAVGFEVDGAALDKDRRIVLPVGVDDVLVALGVCT